MKKLIIVLTLLAIPLLAACSPSSPRLTVVTSTSLLAYIVQEVGADRVEVINLVPPAQHPGDFNVRPGDIEKLAKARLFLLHGWPGEGYADKFIASADNPDLVVIKADVNGNWMQPPVQLAAADRVAGILSQVDSGNASAYQKAAEEYKTRIQAKEAEIRARLDSAAVSGINIIASFRQADFLEWAGFNVIATYTTADSLTPQSVKDLVDKGKAAGVTLVVNNLQDSADAGKGIAEELGAKNINLSNFPGGFDDTATWEKAIDRNIDLLLGASGKT